MSGHHPWPPPKRKAAFPKLVKNLDLIALTKEHYGMAIKSRNDSLALGWREYELPEAGSVVKMWFDNSMEILAAKTIVRKLLYPSVADAPYHPKAPDYRLN